MKLLRTVLLSALSTVSFAALASTASAQVLYGPDEIALPRTDIFARDENVGVLSRPRPEYDPLGIHADSFNIQPDLDTSLEYNSNIYALNTAKKGDEIFHIDPSITATTDWARNQLKFFGRGGFNEYLDHSGESTDTGALGASGRYDVSHELGVAAGASWEHDAESRTSPNSPTVAAHPIEYDLDQAFLVGTAQLSRIRLSGRFDYASYQYDNGQTVTGARVYQLDRDYNVSTETFKAEYAATPGTSIFANLVFNQQENQNLLPTDISRTNSGYEATFGSNFNISHLIKGEVYVGYLDQTFDQKVYKEVSGVSLRGYLQWYPTQLMTITLSGTRVPAVSVITGAGAYLNSNVAARVDYELLRNLIITGALNYENDSYEGVNRTDDRNYEYLTATYLMNRRVGIYMTLLHYQDASSGTLPGVSYNIDSLTAGVRLRY